MATDSAYGQTLVYMAYSVFGIMNQLRSFFLSKALFFKIFEHNPLKFLRFISKPPRYMAPGMVALPS